MTSTNRSVIAASVLALVMAGAASAHADGYGGGYKDAPAPVDHPTYVWDGMYVAFGGGMSQFDHNIDVDAAKSTALEGREHYCTQYWRGFCIARSGFSDWSEILGPYHKYEDASFSGDEWNGFGTLQLGYDRLIHNRFLIGGFADYDFYPGDNKNSYSSPWEWNLDIGDWGDEFEIGSIDSEVELKGMFNIGARMGFLLTPRILVYGVGGYTRANIDGKTTISFDGHPYDALTVNAPDHLDGYFIGGGGEVSLHSNLSLKLEYRYHHLQGETTSGTSTYNTNPFPYHCGDLCPGQLRLSKETSADVDWDADVQTIRGALVLKFGGGHHHRAVEPLK